MTKNNYEMYVFFLKSRRKKKQVGGKLMKKQYNASLIEDFPAHAALEEGIILHWVFEKHKMNNSAMIPPYT